MDHYPPTSRQCHVQADLQGGFGAHTHRWQATGRELSRRSMGICTTNNCVLKKSMATWVSTRSGSTRGCKTKRELGTNRCTPSCLSSATALSMWCPQGTNPKTTVCSKSPRRATRRSLLSVATQAERPRPTRGRSSVVSSHVRCRGRATRTLGTRHWLGMQSGID